MTQLPGDAIVIRTTEDWIIYFSYADNKFFFYPKHEDSNPLKINHDDLKRLETLATDMKPYMKNLTWKVLGGLALLAFVLMLIFGIVKNFHAI